MKKGILYSAITSLMFGVSSIFFKMFYFMGLNSISVNFYVALFPTLALFAQKLISERSLKFLKISKRDFLLSFVNSGIIGLFLISISIITSIQYIPVGIQQMISSSSSVFVVIIYVVFLHKKPTKQDFIACLLVLTGLYFVVGKITITQHNGVAIGFVFCLLSMTAEASYSTVLAENPTNCDDITFWFYAFLGYFTASLVNISLTDGFGSIMPLKNIRDILFVFIATYASRALCYITFKRGLIALGPIKHLIIIAFSPFISVILGVILFRESIAPLQCLGGALILLSSMTPMFIKPRT
ncbi:MAG: DMT family transporter [Methanobrevibacter sp.]|jgi:drug/metabolite transporter (DMT)-like permease|nr:DMT family transporter [Candidatus Methanovirga basalitermitum]